MIFAHVKLMGSFCTMHGFDCSVFGFDLMVTQENNPMPYRSVNDIQSTS